MNRWTSLVTAAVLLATVPAASATTAPAIRATEVAAFFRDGQTFITWKEDATIKGEQYLIYRHTQPITAANFAKAKLIGRVSEGSSKFQEMFQKGKDALLVPRRDTPAVRGRLIPRLVIEPVKGTGSCTMLAPDAGLFVWTVKEAKPIRSYYAVMGTTEVATDLQSSNANTAGPIEEVKQPIGAVKYYVEMGVNKKTKKPFIAREWYIMWMDYELWNPHYIGYAFPFAITPGAFKEGGPCPSAHLDGIGTMSVFTATYTNYGCGDFSRNAYPTWYFGYGTKVRDRADGKLVKQEVANYVQHRILQTVLWARRKYKITDPRFIINGNSMGASGAIGFALQYPKFVSAIWSNEGLTDYGNTMAKRQGREVRLWASSIFGNYGDVKLANPVKFIPFGDPQMDWVCKFDGESVYNIRNAGWFLKANVGVDMPYLNIGHCWQDGSIPAANQAVPFEKVIRDSRQPFSYTLVKGGHGWGSAWGGRMTTLVRWDESRPGFSNVPAVVGFRYNKKDPSSRTYMYQAAWGVKARPIKGKAIVETADSWTLPIFHMAKEGQEEDYVVDVTPRNLQRMKVKAGETFTYEAKSIDGTKTDSSGEIAADKHNLLLVPKVPIRRSGALVIVKRK